MKKKVAFVKRALHTYYRILYENFNSPTRRDIVDKLFNLSSTRRFDGCVIVVGLFVVLQQLPELV